MKVNGLGGIVEAISLQSIVEAGVQGDFSVTFYRTNKSKMEGLCVAKTNIYIGIATRDFYRYGLSVLFHEIGHSYGLPHQKAITYAYEMLQMLSRRKHMHLDLAQMNIQAIKNVMHTGVNEIRPTSFPENKVVCSRRKVYSEVSGLYKDVIPYLDMRPDAKVFTEDGHPITGRLVERTGGDFNAVVHMPLVMGE